MDSDLDNEEEVLRLYEKRMLERITFEQEKLAAAIKEHQWLKVKDLLASHYRLPKIPLSASNSGLEEVLQPTFYKLWRHAMNVGDIEILEWFKANIENFSVPHEPLAYLLMAESYQAIEWMMTLMQNNLVQIRKKLEDLAPDNDLDFVEDQYRFIALRMHLSFQTGMNSSRWSDAGVDYVEKQGHIQIVRAYDDEFQLRNLAHVEKVAKWNLPHKVRLDVVQVALKNKLPLAVIELITAKNFNFSFSPHPSLQEIVTAAVKENRLDVVRFFFKKSPSLKISDYADLVSGTGFRSVIHKFFKEEELRRQYQQENGLVAPSENSGVGKTQKKRI